MGLLKSWQKMKASCLDTSCCTARLIWVAPFSFQEADKLGYCESVCLSVLLDFPRSQSRGCLGLIEADPVSGKQAFSFLHLIQTHRSFHDSYLPSYLIRSVLGDIINFPQSERKLRKKKYYKSIQAAQNSDGIWISKSMFLCISFFKSSLVI